MQLRSSRSFAVALACMSGFGVILGFLNGCESTPKAEKVTSPIAGSYAFWPQFPDEPRIQFVASYSTSDDVAPVKSSSLDKLVFGKDAPKPEIIEKPYGIAMHDGKIYVCDMRGKSLSVLDLRKKQTRLVGVSGANQLVHPVAVAVADDGMIYVADNDRGAVFVFDASERYSAVFGFEKFKPVGVAVHGDRLYAIDLASQRVEVMDRRSGKRLGNFGTVGDGDGQFRTPVGISTDKAGNVYVVDMMRCRVQKFSPEGTYISGLGSLGDYVGSFVRPKHVAVDNDGVVYVVDAAFQNVQMFDDQYRVLMHFGSMGDYPGSMNLPAGIAVSDEGLDLFTNKIHPGFAPKRLIAVTNQFGAAKVSIYAVGEVRKGYTAQDLAAASIKVDTGVIATPSEERLKMASPGGVETEPAPEGDAGGQPPAEKKPEPKPPLPK